MVLYPVAEEKMLITIATLSTKKLNSMNAINRSQPKGQNICFYHFEIKMRHFIDTSPLFHPGDTLKMSGMYVSLNSGKYWRFISE